MTRKRIGAVSYLNTKPLVEGLSALSDDCELIFDLPSRLADRLATGELDVALIPSIEAVTHPDYQIVSDACIGCRGPVGSVKLLSRVPGEQIESVALDVGSRTSRALTKVILKNKFDVSPTVSDLEMNMDWRSNTSDAVLIIGDRAMDSADKNFTHQWDLGETWNRWTGLPFVFAVWAARTEDGLDELGEILSVARDRGMENLARIAAENHETYGLTQESCISYLSEHLHFYLGSEEKNAMSLFFDYAAQLSLIPNNSKLHFHDCQRA
jgi:chorismate dehydratase